MSVLAVAGTLWTPAPAWADACVLTTASQLPPALCLAGEGELDLLALARERGLPAYPVQQIRLDDNAVVALSDASRFQGRIRVIHTTIDRAGLERRGLAGGNVGALKLLPTACIYQDADFRGASLCYPPGEVVSSLPAPLDRAVSSARVPPSLSLKVSTDVVRAGRESTLRQHTGAAGLAAIGMQDAIRSLQVTRTDPPCTSNCLIPTTDAYDLSGLFGTYWRPRAARVPQIAIALAADDGKNTLVQYGPDLAISVRYTGAVALTFQPSRTLASLAPNADVRYVTVALSFRPGAWVELQLARHDAQRRYIDATVPVTLPWPTHMADTLSIRNVSAIRPTEMAELLVGVATETPRAVRGVGCNSNPIFAIINALFHNCTPDRQALKPTAETSTTAGRPAEDGFLVLAGRLPAPAKKTTVDAPPPGNNVMPLDRILSDQRNPFAIHAAARTCNVPLENLPVVRTKRAPGDCFARTSRLIELYQLIFPDHWDAEQYTRVVDMALTNGTIGITSANDPALEAEFVAQIRLQTGARDQRRADAIRAFHHANVLRAYSLARRMDMESLAMRAAPDAQGTPPTGSASPSPASAFHDAEALQRHGVLGLYRLNLRSYVPRLALPRVRRGGAWETSYEPFTFARVHAGDAGGLHDLVLLMRRWAQEYLAEPAPPDGRSPYPDHPYGNSVFLASSGASIAMGIVDEIEQADADNEYIIVSYQGQPMAVLQGRIPRRRSLVAEVGMVVSAPRNVLSPETEGTVRGAATYALHHFLQYAEHRGMESVLTDAVSLPSALVKQRAGFHLVDDDSPTSKR